MSKRVIELIRVSTECQANDDRASIPAQRSINRRTAEIYGLEIVRSIELVNVSGASILRTPEMQSLLKLIESPDIHGVVVREFSRVMRPDSFGDYVLFQVFQETGTVLYLPDGPLDLNSKTGKLVAGLRAIIAGNELSEIRERVFAAKEEKRRAGKFPNGEICLPFGVGYEEKRGWFYKPEAEKMREVFELFLSGDHNYVKLAEIAGVTPRGMHIIMRNPIWMGWRIIDKKRDVGTSARRATADGRQGDRPTVARTAEEIIRVRVITEPLISEERFREVQRIMDTKSRMHWRSHPERPTTFTYGGFLICAACESLVYGKSSRRTHYYICKSRSRATTVRCTAAIMNRDRLEAKLDDIFGVQLMNKEFLGTLIGQLELKYNSGAIRSRVARLEGDVGKLRQKRERVLDAFFEGVLQKAERDIRLASLDKQMKFVEEMLMREVPKPHLSVREMAQAFSPLFDWPVLSRENKRRILRASVPEIHVREYAVSGIAVTLPCRHDETRTAAAFVVADDADSSFLEPSNRLFIPLNL
jgi:DNA invertase Pin-like site-specific DNA recombinase